MTDDAAIVRLLRWRLERAEAEAPPPPSAEELLEGARPGCDRWPEHSGAHAPRPREMPAPEECATPTAAADGHDAPVPVLTDRAGAGEARA